MALYFCDGCDMYTTATDVAGKGWSIKNSGLTINTTGGGYGGGCLTFPQVTFSSPRIVRNNAFPYTSGMSLCIGFLLKQNIAPGNVMAPSNIGLFGMVGGVAASVYTMLSISTTGVIQFAALNGSVNSNTGTKNVCDNTFHWIEVQIVLSSTSTGSVSVYIDGVQDLNLTNIITFNSSTVPTGGVAFGVGSNGYSGSNSITTIIDDIMIWDTTGSNFNQFPMGQQRINTIVPNGPGSSTQLTSSGGANFQVAAQNYSGTGTLVANGGGLTDMYTNSGLGAYNPSKINALVVNATGYNSGNGSSYLIPKIETNSTIVSAQQIPLNTTSTAIQSVFYNDATNAPWTTSSINNSQFGVGD